jgi:hypothetical protein
MTTYAPQSHVGWLDFNDEAAKQVAETLRALQEPSTLDPLGIGSIRDAFADLLAPGTSTIHTRLRYFLFVPWICQRIEDHGITAGQFASRLRRDEATLIECLRHLGSNQGVQGYASGSSLKRMPSSAYWGGLYSWKLRKQSWSIADYGRNITKYRSKTFADGADDTVASILTSIWAELPPAPTDFLEADISFDLTTDEAQFLIQRIRESHPHSLLAAACAQPRIASTADWVWEVDASLLSNELQKLLLDARNISELTLGPQLVYNLLIAQRAGDELKREVGNDVALQIDKLTDWANTISDRQNELRDWFRNIDTLWSLLSQNANIPRPARVFTQQMIEFALRDPHEFFNDKGVHDLIRQREIALKGRRARFINLEGLKEWSSPGFGGPLTYRWAICKSYLADLADGLERDN